jgi:ribosomal protein L37AE/L43A
MATTTETDRMTVADDEVRLTHACPECQRIDTVQRTLTLDLYDPTIECHCQGCDSSWQVYVEPEQSLRNSLWAV